MIDKLGLSGFSKEQKSSKIVLQGRPIKSISYSRFIPIRKSNVDDFVAVKAPKITKLTNN
jgi:hypothetical protein